MKEILVSGKGYLTAEPDYAEAIVGVRTSHANAQEARTENSAAIIKVKKALKKAGVSEADVETKYIDLQPNYTVVDNEQKITGYNVTHSLSVKIRDLDKLADTINSALISGANQLNSVQYNVNNHMDFYSDATKIAMADAKNKAMIIADMAGVKLGKICSVRETAVGNFPGAMPRFAAGDAMMMKVDIGDTLVPSPVVIDLGFTVSFKID